MYSLCTCKGYTSAVIDREIIHTFWIITSVTCLNTKIYIGFHESVGDPDSKEANLSWMPYKDLKILNKKLH